MISLRVAILFALSTQFVNYAVCGYAVVPFPSENSLPESETLESKPDPLPETLYTPVIETTTVPISEEPPEVSGATYAAAPPNLTVSDRAPRQAIGSGLWRDCSNGKGCFIKHFRQYNYYYPNRQNLMAPAQNPKPFTAEELLPNDGIPVPVTSSIRMTNDNGRVSVQTSSSNRPTVSYNLPGVTSYVPNNGFNYIYNQFDSGLRQNGAQSYAGTSTFDQRTASEEEQVLSEEASVEQSNEPNQDDDSSSSINVNKDVTTYVSGPNMFGQNRIRTYNNGNNGNFQSQQVSISSRVQSQPFQVQEAEAEQEVTSTSESSTQDEDESSTSSSSGNVNKDITTYFSGPNMYGQSREIVVKNGNNRNFQSQQVSMSSGVQSKPLPVVEEAQEEVSTTTSSKTKQSQPLPSLNPALNLANYYAQNRLIYGYDPYFQSYHQLGVSPALPTLPMAGYPGQIYNPYLNPVSSWVNYPTQSTLYDLPGMTPAYSVIL